MTLFPIGVLIDSFRTDIQTALKMAAAIGVTGIQVYATHGDMSPEAMTAQRRREFRDMVASYGLEISALCGDLGRGFTDPKANPELIEKSRRILDLAVDLGTNVVTTHIGVVPEDPIHERFGILQEACGVLSTYADDLNAHFAIETGPETAETLRRFLDTLHSKGVAVNYDPANLVMVMGDDPVKGVYTLKDYIVHTHAKDGRRLFTQDAESIYSHGTETVPTGPSYVELPLGSGDVDFPQYLKALDEIGYRGYLTIEREVGESPEEDIRLAHDFLVKCMNA